MTDESADRLTTVEIEVASLRRVPMFRRLSDNTLRLLAFTSEMRLFREGEDVFRQGDMGDSAYILLAGSADVFVEMTDGGRMPVARLGPNDLFGEVALLCDTGRTATVTAAGEMRALRIEKETLFRLAREFPDIAFEIMRVLALRLERTTRELSKARAGS